MAKFDYSSYENAQSKKGFVSKEKSKVGYFNSLKDDGDETIVRFMYSSPSEFDMLTVHKLQIDSASGKVWRNISCLRTDAHEPFSKCPLCEKGEKVFERFFVKMLEYVRDENGNVVPQAKVWDRPATFTKQLKSYFEEYGDISDYVFKLKRHGARGCLQTSYDVIPANQSIYKPEIYVKDFSAFDGFDMSHHSYMNKSYDDMATFVKTGEFPFIKKDEQTNDNVVHTQEQPATQYQQTRPNYGETSQHTEQSDPTQSRPRRTYNY